jgi:uncharacterized protein YbjT (DUF2867 family)
MLRNALIVGATGLTGQSLISRLTKTDYYNSLHIIVRRPYALEHPKIKSYVVDFEKISEFKPEALIQDVYICLGTTMKKAGSKEEFRKVDYEYVVQIGKWAKNNKVERLAVISSIGASSRSKNYYLKAKGDMEDFLAGLNLPRLVILRPSLLLGKREEFRLAEKVSSVILKPLKNMMTGFLRKYKPVETSTVAEAMFRSLSSAEEGVTVMENEAIVSFE